MYENKPKTLHERWREESKDFILRKKTNANKTFANSEKTSDASENVDVDEIIRNSCKKHGIPFKELK